MNTTQVPNRRPTRCPQRRGMRVLALLVAGLAGLLVPPASPAHAHASVLVVSPASSSELKTAPRSVSIRFNEPVTADAKRVQLLDAKGKVVTAHYRADANGALQVLTPTKALAAGLYAMRWSVVSDDGHVVTGASTFTVKVKAPTRKGMAFTLASGSKTTRAALTASRVGAMTVKAPSGAFVRAEFKHRRLGATLTVALTGGQARVVLPFAGAWTVTMVEKSGTFTELRWAGSVTLR